MYVGFWVCGWCKGEEEGRMRGFFICMVERLGDSGESLRCGGVIRSRLIVSDEKEEACFDSFFFLRCFYKMPPSSSSSFLPSSSSIIINHHHQPSSTTNQRTNHQP